MKMKSKAKAQALYQQTKSITLVKSSLVNPVMVVVKKSEFFIILHF